MVAASDKPFPVILLAPGSISFPSKYSSLAEDLASHGIVVVGDVPVGNGIVVSFPAGNVTRGYRGAMFDEWAGDLIYELDQLRVWNQTPRHLFFGRLDLGRVGAFGHWAGGMIVSRIPHMDRRVKAVALLDPGSVRPEDGEAVPVLVLKSGHKDNANSREKAKNETEHVRSAKPGVQMKLVGSEHPSFTPSPICEGLGVRVSPRKSRLTRGCDFGAAQFALCCGPDSRWPCTDTGRLLSSFHPMSYLAETSNMTTRRRTAIAVAGLAPAGQVALQAATHMQTDKC